MKKQYSVLRVVTHKTIGNGLERHIDRCSVTTTKENKVEIEVWVPDNADAGKTDLNRELIDSASHQVIPHRINKTTQRLNNLVNERLEESKVKLRTGQNTCVEMILTGSHETMTAMQYDTIMEWAKDSTLWAQKKFGVENVISSVLHVDEATPHLHIIIVPIVKGISRRTKFKYTRIGIKMPPDYIGQARLSANDVFNRVTLPALHTSYARTVGAKYGLQRGEVGEPGSKKKHQSSQDYNRELTREAKLLEEEVNQMEHEKQKLEDESRALTQRIQELSNPSLFYKYCLIAERRFTKQLIETINASLKRNYSLVSYQLTENGDCFVNVFRKINGIRFDDCFYISFSGDISLYDKVARNKKWIKNDPKLAFLLAEPSDAAKTIFLNLLTSETQKKLKKG